MAERRIDSAALRRIPIDQLQPGMYVEQLDRSWLLVPVFHNRIRSDDQVQRLKEWDVREVVINTAKGTDLPGAPRPAPADPAAPVQLPEVDAVPFEAEVVGANRVYEATLHSVTRMMDAVRDGASPDVAVAEAAVDDMIASILRNRDALVTVSSLREYSEAVFQHCVRCCILTLAFGAREGFSHEELRAAGIGALLHDVGKMRLPRELVEKKTPFSPEEFEAYRGHALLGAKLFDENSRIEKQSLLVLLQHHERADGSGFPQGLVSDEISRMARMVMIVDTYDNLTSGHQGRSKLTPYEALKWIQEFGGDGFEAELVHEFVGALGLYPVGSFVRLSDSRMALVLSVHHNAAMLPKVQVVFDEKHRLLPEGEVIDLAEQDSAHPVSIVTSLLPEKVGFDLAGYVAERGLFSGGPPNPALSPETRNLP